MITPRRIFGLLSATSLLLASAIFSPPSAAAAENGRYERERISVEHARVARTPQRAPRRESVVAKAAKGRLPDAAADAPLEGPRVRNKVRQVGFLESYGSQCGPVCDCDQCNPGCGVEEIHYGEPGCGVEIGCGLGAAINRVGSIMSPGCGIEGCTDCYEHGCGVEFEHGCGVEFEHGCGVEEIYGDPGCGIETYGDCSCDACTGQVGHLPLCLPYLRMHWTRFDVFAGVQGFTGPLNFVSTNAADSGLRSGSGSFGFYQGVNEGRSYKKWIGCDLSGQLGVRTTQSNISGSGFIDEARYQVFVTGGLFRRVDYGLQYGVVFDYLNQNWYFKGNSIQLRGEMSWRHNECHTCGFQFMAGLRTETRSTQVADGSGGNLVSTVTFRPTDQYRFFYRRDLRHSGFYDVFAGWTDRDDGLLGGSVQLPVRRRLVLATGATYLIPREGSRSRGFEEEGWNVSVGLIFRPGGPKGCGRYCRPLFDVADNGTFLIDRE